MGRPWCKLWAVEWLYGGISKESSDVRAAFICCLSAACESHAEGKILIGDESKQIAYTDPQLAQMFNLSVDVWLAAKQRLIERESIACDDGIIKIVNWPKYQSEYDRQKQWRDKQKEGDYGGRPRRQSKKRPTR